MADIKNNIMNSEKVFINLPLYEKVELEVDSTENKISTGKILSQAFLSNGETIDIYCPMCKRESVFDRGRLMSGAGTGLGRTYKDPYLELVESLQKTPKVIYLYCKRDSNHTLSFIYKIEDSNFIKVGQYPAIADLQLPIKDSTKKYLRQIDKLTEFNRAIGLISHGIGIGSFVYLRRIFEKIISIKVEEKVQNEGIEEDKIPLKIEDKIFFLRGIIPDFIIGNRKIYSILSVGIHELSEEECKNYFQIIKQGIEIICEEILQHEERIQNIKKFETELNEVHKKIKK